MNDKRDRWQFTFEWVIVPMTGLSLFVYGAVTNRVTGAWIPPILGLIAYPLARTVDRLRQRDT